MASKVKVYTTTPGLTLRIGNHGEASNEVPAMVPSEVADEFVKRKDLRIERERHEPAATKTKPPAQPAKTAAPSGEKA